MAGWGPEIIGRLHQPMHKHTKGGSQAVLNGVITLFSRVITPVIHFFRSFIGVILLNS